jgi:hypothetical protein
MALVGAAATLTWQFDGGEAKRTVARWVSQIPLASWPPVRKQGIAEPSSQPPVQAATATAQAPQPTAPQAVSQQPAPQQSQPQQQASQQPVSQQPVSQPPASQQPAPSALAAPEAAASTAVVLPPELTQSLQAMARDLATVQQGMEQLKANQEQMSRDIAKLTEQDARHKASLPPSPRPTPIPARPAARRPAPAFPPPQAAVQPRYTPPPPPPVVPPPVVVQPPVQPQLSSAPRPPAPVP